MAEGKKKVAAPSPGGASKRGNAARAAAARSRERRICLTGQRRGAAHGGAERGSKVYIRAHGLLCVRVRGRVWSVTASRVEGGGIGSETK